MSPARDLMGRRRFLWTAALAALAAACGEWWQSWRPEKSAPVAAAFRIPAAADLRPGSALNFSLPGADAAAVLVRLNDGAFAAFDRRCPHLGCPVLWSAQRERFECPCHKAIFDAASGRVLGGPPQSGLRRIAVAHRGTELWALPPCDDDSDDDDDGTDDTDDERSA